MALPAGRAPSCVAPDLPTACGRWWLQGAVALYADLPATQYRDVAIAAALAALLMDSRSLLAAAARPRWTR